MARSGGQPTAALAITFTSFPVRRGFILTRRSCCEHNHKSVVLSLSSHLVLFLYSLFILMPGSGSYTVATCSAVSAPSYHFPFHKSIFADLSTLFFRRPSLFSHLAFFSRRLALRFHAFEWQLATCPAGSALSYHFPLHNSTFADLYTL